MGFISDLLTNISAFRIKVGEKLNWLNANKANVSALTDYVKKDGSVEMLDSLRMSATSGLSSNIVRDLSANTSGGISRPLISIKGSVDEIGLWGELNNGSLRAFVFADENYDSIGIEFQRSGNIVLNDATANNHAVTLGQVNGLNTNKANVNGSNIPVGMIWNNLKSGNSFLADNSITWNGQSYLGSTGGNINFIMTYDSFQAAYRPSTISEVQIALGIDVINSQLGSFAFRDGSNLQSIPQWQVNLGINLKANQSGYYSGLSVGNADNSTLWNGNEISNTSSANFTSLMGYNPNTFAWHSIAISDVKNGLGLGSYVLQTSLNAQLVNYATLAGTQTFSGQITFSQAPIAPAGTLAGHTVNLGQVTTLLNDKVDKVAGKQLSTEDYTSAEKTKLSGIAAGAEVNVNADWNATSGDANILNKPTIPTNNNQLTNGAGYITALALTGYATQTYVTSQGYQNASQVSTTVTNQISNLGFAPIGHSYQNITANGTPIDASQYRRVVAVFSDPSVTSAALSNNAYPGTVVTLQTTSVQVDVTMDYRKPNSSGSMLPIEAYKSVQVSFSEDQNAWIVEQDNSL